MTAKRFTHKEDDWEILDNGEHLAYAHSDYQADKICGLLNKLHEEKEIAIEGVQIANDLIMKYGSEELKHEWQKNVRVKE